jgi:hypothetical protein
MACRKKRQAQDLIGKYVVVGLTFIDANGREVEKTQRHGTVERADQNGIHVRLLSPGHDWDGELYSLPPDVSGFAPAEPGTYRLHSTGEEVEDPDFTAAWVITEDD